MTIFKLYCQKFTGQDDIFVQFVKDSFENFNADVNIVRIIMANNILYALFYVCCQICWLQKFIFYCIYISVYFILFYLYLHTFILNIRFGRTHKLEKFIYVWFICRRTKDYNDSHIKLLWILTLFQINICLFM